MRNSVMKQSCGVTDDTVIRNKRNTLFACKGVLKKQHTFTQRMKKGNVNIAVHILIRLVFNKDKVKSNNSEWEYKQVWREW